MNEIQEYTLFDFKDNNLSSSYLSYSEEIKYLDKLREDIRKLNDKIKLIALTSKEVKNIKNIEQKNKIVINKCLIDKKQNYFYTIWIKDKYSYYISLYKVIKRLNSYGIRKVYIRINYGYSLKINERGMIKDE